MRLFKHQNTVVNFDTDGDAERFMTRNPEAVEFTKTEIASIFGDHAHLAGPTNTAVDDDGNITFTIPDEYRDLGTWKDVFVRPERNRRLEATDLYMLPDYPISDTTMEEIKTYRQKLRDFMSTLTEIVPLDSLAWPTLPEAFY